MLQYIENNDQHCAVPQNIHTPPMHMHKICKVLRKGDLEHHSGGRVGEGGESNQNKGKLFWGKYVHIFLEKHTLVLC